MSRAAPSTHHQKKMNTDATNSPSPQASNEGGSPGQPGPPAEGGIQPLPPLPEATSQQPDSGQ